MDYFLENVCIACGFSDTGQSPAHSLCGGKDDVQGSFSALDMSYPLLDQRGGWENNKQKAF